MSDIDELRRIILGGDYSNIDTLHQRVSDPKRRTEDVAEILSDSISISAKKDPALAYSLQEPVTECVKIAARKHTRFFADALFPVIMPAIRRSIAEVLRSFVQTINQTVEHSLSPQGLKWRFESMRTGVPFAEIVLKHSLVYRVDQVFLIHSASGLLIDYVAHPDVVARDNDAVSAMLTAIGDFARDSFNIREHGKLGTVEIGGESVWLFHSPHAMMACVISGIAPLKLREQLARIMEELDTEFGALLEQFKGEGSALLNVKPTLEKCLLLELSSEKEGIKRKPSWVTIAVLAIVIGLVLYAVISHFLQQRRFDQLTTALESIPGVVLIDTEEKGSKLVVKGLQDPLAADLEGLIGQTGLEKEDVVFDMKPYYAVENSIVLARVQQLLDVPEGVNLSLKQGILHASGVAPRSWLETSVVHAAFINGVDKFEIDDVRVFDENPIHNIMSLLSPPESIALDFQDELLTIQGNAPWAWIKGLPGTLTNVKGLRHLEFKDLRIQESVKAVELVRRLNKSNFYFSRGLTIRDDSLPMLSNVILQMKILQGLAIDSNSKVQVELVGYSDGLDTRDRNQMMTQQRAQLIRNRLVDAGVSTGMLFTLRAVLGDPLAGYDAELRRVTMNVSLKSPDIAALFDQWQ